MERRLGIWERIGRILDRRKQRKPPENLGEIELVVFDFDGVFTDNSVFVTQDGYESVACNRMDGLGIGMLRATGLEIMVLSTEENPVVSARCRKLRIPCRQGVADKSAFLAGYLSEKGIDRSRVAYLGNDVNDLDCLRMVGFPVVVADAHPEVKKAARWTLGCAGGKGAVREFCDVVVPALTGSKNRC